MCKKSDERESDKRSGKVLYILLRERSGEREAHMEAHRHGPCHALFTELFPDS